ncbi:MAG: mechanosensitive ion channel family protein [Phycisphaeraceae bacterium]
MSVRPRYIRLVFPLAVTLLLALLARYGEAWLGVLGIPPRPAAGQTLFLGLLAALCLASAWLGSVLIDVFLWESVVQRRTGAAPPRLLVAMVRVTLYALVLVVIIRVIYNQAIDALLLSSGVIGIVLGLALQRMISDFFSGIALSFEKPFSLGHWISIDGVAGKVVGMNWRATHLVTLDDVTVVLPNSFIGERRFLNYDLPLHYFRTELPVTLEFAVPVVDGKRVLLAALRAAPGIRVDPPPDVVVKEFGHDGVVYRCRFYLTSYMEINVVGDAVATSISQHLWHAGMRVALPQRDLYMAPMPPRQIDRVTDRHTLLARTELFAGLDDEDTRQLAAGLVERRIAMNAQVVRQGEPGSSLFVLVDGLLQVSVNNNGSKQVVGQIAPGQFFGEMSLLSGEPRSATVTAISESTVYELTHEHVAPVLQRRGHIAEALSHVLADRRLRNEARLRQLDDPILPSQQRTLTAEILHKMRAFFGLGGGA